MLNAARESKYYDTLFQVLDTMEMGEMSKDRYRHIMSLVCKLHDHEPESDRLEVIYERLEGISIQGRHRLADWKGFGAC